MASRELPDFVLKPTRRVKLHERMAKPERIGAVLQRMHAEGRLGEMTLGEVAQATGSTSERISSVLHYLRSTGKLAGDFKLRSGKQKMVHEQVREMLEKGHPPYAEFWRKDSRAHSLYMQVAKRDEKGILRGEGKKKYGSFYGTGGWYDYLQKHVGISALKQAVHDGKKYSRLTHYPEELHYLAGETLGRLGSTSVADWEGDEKGRKLYRLIVGSQYGGHGSFEAYLKANFPGAERYANLRKRQISSGQADLIHRRVRNKYRELKTIRTTAWCADREAAAVYKAVLRRNSRGEFSESHPPEERFFGTGSWAAYMEKFHGVTRSS